MNFPSFILTGPAAEMPVAPISYPMLNLMPAVQALRKEKTSGSPSKKGDDSKIDIDATRGQAEQWQRNYDSVMSKMNAIVAYEGEDAIKTNPRLACNYAYLAIGVGTALVTSAVMFWTILRQNRKKRRDFVVRTHIASSNMSNASLIPGLQSRNPMFSSMLEMQHLEENQVIQQQSTTTQSIFTGNQCCTSFE